ncbi:hypothetical protein CUMW_000190 [Citrus unshiu]|nr:hypothetical protein CUMW_000190 [Citrus unshiu]
MASQQGRQELDTRPRQGETVVPGGTGGKSLEAQEHLAEGTWVAEEPGTDILLVHDVVSAEANFQRRAKAFRPGVESERPGHGSWQDCSPHRTRHDGHTSPERP